MLILMKQTEADDDKHDGTPADENCDAHVNADVVASENANDRGDGCDCDDN